MFRYYLLVCWELVVERDKTRKKSQSSVDQRIHYLWFHYLKLCMNLEQIGYRVQKKKKGNHQPSIIEKEIKVIVNKDIYIDWSLNSLYEMKFHVWYENPEHRLLFSEGGFKYGGRSRYSSLVKRYNVFVEFQNRMKDFEYTRGDMTKEMKISEDIIELYQKERFDRLKINHPHSDNRSPFNKIIKEDIRDCHKTLLAVCEGRFPK